MAHIFDTVTLKPIVRLVNHDYTNLAEDHIIGMAISCNQ